MIVIGISLVKLIQILYTDDFWSDYESYRAKGVVFVREPKYEPHRIVAVFLDLYGNMWDLLQPTESRIMLRNDGSSIQKISVP